MGRKKETLVTMHRINLDLNLLPYLQQQILWSRTVHLCNNENAKIYGSTTTKASGLSNFKTFSIFKLISNFQVHDNNLVHLFEDMRSTSALYE
jgi:hypothetical protein